MSSAVVLSVRRMIHSSSTTATTVKRRFRSPPLLRASAHNTRMPDPGDKFPSLEKKGLQASRRRTLVNLFSFSAWVNAYPKFPIKLQELQEGQQRTTWCMPTCILRHSVSQMSCTFQHRKDTQHGSPQTHLRQRHVGSPDNIENHAGRLVDGELQKRRDYRPDRGILRASLSARTRGVDRGGEGEGAVVQVSPAGKRGGGGGRTLMFCMP